MSNSAKLENYEYPPPPQLSTPATLYFLVPILNLLFCIGPPNNPQMLCSSQVEMANC